MTWLVTTSLRLRVLVLALCGVLLVVGARTLRTTPLDVFPEFAPPLVEVQTEAPGLSTEEVESLISMPLENALNGTPWMKTIRSKSVLGLSSVVLIFQDGTDSIRPGKSCKNVWLLRPVDCRAWLVRRSCWPNYLRRAVCLRSGCLRRNSRKSS